MNDFSSSDLLPDLNMSTSDLLAVMADRERYLVEAITQREGVKAESADLAPPAASNADLRQRISQRAYDLIVGFETGGRAYYESPNGINKRPVWPGAQSGVTVGCGYDLGYHSQDEFRAAWQDVLDRRHFQVLAGAIGLKGRAARDFMPRVRHVVIEWGEALAVFDAVTLIKYARLTADSLPQAVDAHPHCFGALVSLVFNRGAWFRLAGDRYREMRRIRELVASGDLRGIPAQFRAMKRLWQGQGVDGLLIRRDKEAELFQAGLDAARTVETASVLQSHMAPGGARRVSAQAATEASRAEGADDLTWLQDLPPDELDRVIYEPGSDDDSFSAAPAGQPEAARRRYTASDVRWVANDANHPDYTHLPPDAKGRPFDLTADDLDVLIRLNRFAPEKGGHGRVLFALRGARLLGDTHAQENVTAVRAIDVRPNHVDFRCVIGVYDFASRKLSAYTASSVCNAGAVVACYNFYAGFTTKKQGNILPTGCYELCVGTHFGSVQVPGVFRLGNGPVPAQASKHAVLRTGNDVTLGTQDIWDPCKPSDNLHPAFGNTRFSSLGCLTVRGTYSNRHEGEWAKLRKAAGLVSGQGDGTRYDIVLLTGLDAATIAGMREAGAEEADVAAALSCLRQGSRGEEVRRLRTQLALSDGDEFDWRTAEVLAAAQRQKLGWATGIYGTNMDVLLGFRIFGDAVV